MVDNVSWWLTKLLKSSSTIKAGNNSLYSIRHFTP